MHQLYKSKRRFSSNQGPTPYSNSCAIAASAGLPSRYPLHLLISYLFQPTHQITTVRPGASEAPAVPHASRAALSSTSPSSTLPSTLNHTDKPPPPSQPYTLWYHIDITTRLSMCLILKEVVLLPSILLPYSKDQLHAETCVFLLSSGIESQAKLQAHNYSRVTCSCAFTWLTTD